MKKQMLIRMMFVVASLVQLGVPAAMVFRYEATLAHGAVYKFKTQPVDPYDAFRGRFVAIRIDPDRFTLPPGTESARGRKAYARLGAAADGFARIEDLTLERPSQGPYVPVSVPYWQAGEVFIRWPFDRVYLNEKMAPQAEAVYREHSRAAGPRDAYVTVRVHDGNAVVEDLYIGEKRIQDYFQKL